MADGIVIVVTAAARHIRLALQAKDSVGRACRLSRWDGKFVAFLSKLTDFGLR
jgi:hypothetical protein